MSLKRHLGKPFNFANNHLTLCVGILGTDCKNEYYNSTTISHNNIDIDVVVEYIYAQNDIFCQGSTHILPFDVSHRSTIYKVIYLLDHFNNIGCDVVAKSDDDVVLNLDNIVKNLIGYQIYGWSIAGHLVYFSPFNCLPWHKHFDPGWFKLTRRFLYPKYFPGALYIMGRKMVDCILQSENMNIALQMRNEDVAIGYLAQECRPRYVPLNEFYYGHPFKERRYVNEDFIAIHKREKEFFDLEEGYWVQKKLGDIIDFFRKKVAIN